MYTQNDLQWNDYILYNDMNLIDNVECMQILTHNYCLNLQSQTEDIKLNIFSNLSVFARCVTKKNKYTSGKTPY